MNWTYEKCKEEASKYETRSEFSKGNCSAYNASRSNGWLDDFFVKKKRNYKTCREEAKKSGSMTQGMIKSANGQRKCAVRSQRNTRPEPSS